jgi:hypothetical protein
MANITCAAAELLSVRYLRQQAGFPGVIVRCARFHPERVTMTFVRVFFSCTKARNEGNWLTPGISR